MKDIFPGTPSTRLIMFPHCFYFSELRPFTKGQPSCGYKICLFQANTRCCGIAQSIPSSSRDLESLRRQFQQGAGVSTV